jgi:hypothetical protein
MGSSPRGQRECITGGWASCPAGSAVGFNSYLIPDQDGRGEMHASRCADAPRNTSDWSAEVTPERGVFEELRVQRLARKRCARTRARKLFQQPAPSPFRSAVQMDVVAMECGPAAGAARCRGSCTPSATPGRSVEKGCTASRSGISRSVSVIHPARDRTASARYPTQDGFAPGMISHPARYPLLPAWYPTRPGIPKHGLGMEQSL